MYPDCGRRQAARMFPVEIREAGFTLRQIPPSVGASVGTGTHSAVGHLMEHKASHDVLLADSICEEIGITELHKRVQDEGVRWDPTSPNLNTAEKQVRRQFKTYRIHLAPIIRPVQVERRITFKTKRGNELSGQIDLADDGIRDLKTGTTKRSNLAQYGGYAMLRRAEGGRVPHIKEDYVARVRLDKEQPPPEVIDYDPELSQRVAARIVESMEDDYDAFNASGDNMVFMANPNTVLCGDKFCPAWGTDWCEEGRK